MKTDQFDLFALSLVSKRTLYFVMLSCLGILFSAVSSRAQPVGFFVDVKPVAGLEGPWRDESPFVTPDGLTIYFNSERPNVSSQIEIDKRDIWMATRDAISSPFNEPTKVQSVSQDGVSDHYAYLYNDRLTMFFNSNRGGASTTYSAVRASVNDDWSVPELVTMGLASPPGSVAAEVRLTADGLTAVYEAADEGSRELFIATRDSVTDPFGNASPISNVNLPNREEFHPHITPDGRALFFDRARLGFIRPELYVSFRSNTSEVFGPPLRLDQAFPGSDDLFFQVATFNAFVTEDWPADGSKLYFTSADSLSDFDLYEATWQAIPEPTTGLLLVLGCFLSGFMPRRCKRAFSGPKTAVETV